MMPIMGGMAFLERLRKDPLHAGLPVFVLTGKRLSAPEEQALLELASAAILKAEAAEVLGEYLGAVFTLKEEATAGD